MSSYEDGRSVGVRRLAVLALVGMMLLGGVSGMPVGSTGIAAAQQGGSAGGGNTTTPEDKGQANPVKKTVTKFKEKDLPWSSLSAEGKKKVKELLRDLWKKNLSTAKEKAKIDKIIDLMESSNDGPFWDGGGQVAGPVKKILENVLGVPGRGSGPPSTGPVQKAITLFKQNDVGYRDVSKKSKKNVKSILRKFQKKNLSKQKREKLSGKLVTIIKGGVKQGEETWPYSSSDTDAIFSVLEKVFNEKLTIPRERDPELDINIFGVVEDKMRAIGHYLMKGAAAILTDVYKTAFSTPVPQNTGWHGIFGTPTNGPFQNLYQNLLVKTLYPLTNLLLGIGIIFMGLSLVVNPLISRFRAWNLMIKFTTFILLYGFSWVAVTLMHGAVNDITMWIAPSAKEVGGLITNVGKMSGIAIGAYFVGSSGIMATAFGLAAELQMRLVLLKWFFPYIFAPLILILYVSPWRRLRMAASTALWQYVNVLIMVIPMALFLKAATLVNVGNSLGETLHAMIVLCVLFGAALSMPIFTTWFFFKVPGQAAEGVKSAGKGAAKRAGKYSGGRAWNGAKSAGGKAKSGGSRVGGAVKDRMGWGDDSDSVMDEPNPSDRAEEQVEASVETDTGLSDSGSLDSSAVENMPADGYTTAGVVRELDEEQNSDTSPMNHEEMVESYYEEPSHQTTLDQQLAD